MKKRGQVFESLIPWIVGLVVLGLLIALYITLKSKGISIGEYLRDLVRFGK